MARNTSVTLGDHFEQFIAEKIQQGQYQSISEAVRDGLRQLEYEDNKRKALRAKLVAGEKSPIVKDFNEERFLKKMHKKHGE